MGCVPLKSANPYRSESYPWLEPDDIRACLLYARRLVGHERIEPALVGSSIS